MDRQNITVSAVGVCVCAFPFAGRLVIINIVVVIIIINAADIIYSAERHNR